MAPILRNPEKTRPAQPGWWLASDGLWYAPESAPDVVHVVLRNTRYEGGHPILGDDPLKGMLSVSSWGVFLYTYPEGATAAIPMTDVTSLDVGGQEVGASKVGAVLAFGVLGGLAAKGTKSQATIVLRTRDSNAAYFTVDDGIAALQLRGQLAPVLRAARVPFADELPAAGAGASAGGPDVTAHLREVAALRDDGIITDAEFETLKARILDR